MWKIKIVRALPKIVAGATLALAFVVPLAGPCTTGGESCAYKM